MDLIDQVPGHVIRAGQARALRRGAQRAVDQEGTGRVNPGQARDIHKHGMIML